jgi:adenosylcobinamide kinase/adenosylcobinamide-phosphate guanylyltransferase
MQDRIKKHRTQRGEKWETVEGYKDLPSLLKSVDKTQVVLLDCLTNMISNLLLENHIDWDMVTPEEVNEMEKGILEEINLLLDYIENSESDFIIVSNELGMGLVPPYPLGRYFRDIAGRINQLIASKSEEAYLVVSGLKLPLK